MLGTQYVLLRSMNNARMTASVSILFPEMGFGMLTAVCQSLPSERVSRPTWQCPLGGGSRAAGGLTARLEMSVTTLPQVNGPGVWFQILHRPGTQVQILIVWQLPPLFLRHVHANLFILRTSPGFSLMKTRFLCVGHVCLEGQVLSEAELGVRVTRLCLNHTQIC